MSASPPLAYSRPSRASAVAAKALIARVAADEGASDLRTGNAAFHKRQAPDDTPGALFGRMQDCYAGGKPLESTFTETQLREVLAWYSHCDTHDVRKMRAATLIRALEPALAQGRTGQHSTNASGDVTGPGKRHRDEGEGAGLVEALQSLTGAAATKRVAYNDVAELRVESDNYGTWEVASGARELEVDAVAPLSPGHAHKLASLLAVGSRKSKMSQPHAVERKAPLQASIRPPAATAVAGAITPVTAARIEARRKAQRAAQTKAAKMQEPESDLGWPLSHELHRQQSRTNEATELHAPAAILQIQEPISVAEPPALPAGEQLDALDSLSASPMHVLAPAEFHSTPSLNDGIERAHSPEAEVIHHVAPRASPHYVGAPCSPPNELHDLQFASEVGSMQQHSPFVNGGPGPEMMSETPAAVLRVVASVLDCSVSVPHPAPAVSSPHSSVHSDILGQSDGIRSDSDPAAADGLSDTEPLPDEVYPVISACGSNVDASASTSAHCEPSGTETTAQDTCTQQIVSIGGGTAHSTCGSISVSGEQAPASSSAGGEVRQPRKHSKSAVQPQSRPSCDTGNTKERSVGATAAFNSSKTTAAEPGSGAPRAVPTVNIERRMTRSALEAKAVEDATAKQRTTRKQSRPTGAASQPTGDVSAIGRGSGRSDRGARTDTLTKNAGSKSTTNRSRASAAPTQRATVPYSGSQAAVTPSMQERTRPAPAAPSSASRHADTSGAQAEHRNDVTTAQPMGLHPASSSALLTGQRRVMTASGKPLILSIQRPAVGAVAGMRFGGVAGAVAQVARTTGTGPK